MSRTLPTDTNLDVSFTLRLPAEADMEDVMAWLRFELGAAGRLSRSNALMGLQLRDGRGRDVRVVATDKEKRK